jgi:hypothetical protein
MSRQQTRKETKSAASIEAMNIMSLRAEYEKTFGLKTTSKNKDYLRKRITSRLQEVARERAAVRAARAEDQRRDPRLPETGTILEREHDGKVRKVKMLERGFEYAGETYASLSSVAKAITGTVWNGWAFFGHALAAAKGATP